MKTETLQDLSVYSTYKSRILKYSVEEEKKDLFFFFFFLLLKYSGCIR